MYCPRCGHQPISDVIRFCSYCGFKLGVVKASLSDDDEGRAPEPSTTQVLTTPERQRDINIGVILMFFGALIATLLAGRGGFGLGREGGAVILAAAFSSILLFSRPLMKLIYRLLSWEDLPPHSLSLSQRRMMFGSILMFTSTIFLAISSLLMFGRMRTPEFLFGLVAAFVLLLITSKYLLRALRYLVAGDADVAVFSRTDTARDPVTIGDAVTTPALNGRQDVPVSLFTSPRVTTAEILAPPSVTEQTTNLLENK
jgi:hypothetical protein